MGLPHSLATVKVLTPKQNATPIPKPRFQSIEMPPRRPAGAKSERRVEAKLGRGVLHHGFVDVHNGLTF